MPCAANKLLCLLSTLAWSTEVSPAHGVAWAALLIGSIVGCVGLSCFLPDGGRCCSWLLHAWHTHASTWHMRLAAHT
jgi:hypothetical protein